MYKQQTPLPCKVEHQFAGTTDGDNFFFRKKFAEYQSGEVFMHMELLTEKLDNYYPEERMLDSNIIKKNVNHNTTTLNMDINASTARILDDNVSVSAPPQRKCCRNPLPAADEILVETVLQEDNEEDVSSMSAGPSPDQMHQQKIAREAAEKYAAEATRANAARVLERANNQQS